MFLQVFIFDPSVVAHKQLLESSKQVSFTLGTALLTRLMVLWNVMTTRPHDWLFTRGIEMGLLAKSLLLGQGYSSPFGGSTGPTAFIAPGYPTLIAVIFWIFGTYSFASAVAIMLVQIAASVATVWLILWIARETLDERTANLAGTFWAISPPLLFIPTIFWETSLSAGSLVAIIALALRCQRQPSTRAWMAMGAASGIIGLINPALLPSLLAILAWTAWQTRKSARTAPLLGFAALLLVFSPWPIRNALRFHAFIPTRTTVGFELWMGNRPGATGYLNESIFPMYNKEELASYIAKGELAYTQDKTEQAETYIREYPGIFIKMTMRRVFRFWTGTGNQTGTTAYAIHAILTTSLGFIGIVLLYRRRMNGFATLMVLPLLIFPLPYYITHAEFRYRLNIDPILTILAAYAVTQLANRSVETQAG
jgi:4-amino-4-deoxy-L-arabinose transferase-like glycosyltransferase